jgi:hypothetical protein
MEDDHHQIAGDDHERSEDAVEAAFNTREEGAQERPYATCAISGWAISIEQRDDRPISTTDTNRLTCDMGDEIPESATGEEEYRIWTGCQ